MRLQDLIRHTSANLSSEKNFLLPEINLLLAHILNQSLAFIYTHPEKQLLPTQIKIFNSYWRKRQAGVPLAYLVKQKSFYDLNFKVNHNTLIPRPESEILVARTLEIIDRKYPAQKVILADIGTGSCCLAISLAKNNPKLEIIATDISPQALYLARRNAHLHQVKSQITFRLGNLLEPLKSKKINIIIANLPYIPQGYSQKLDKFYNQGLKFEPKIALYSGVDGLKHYRHFFNQLRVLKSKPHFILIEIDPDQVIKLKKIILSILPQSQITIIQDLNKKNRFLQIEIN
jgi:release factor glutamine methyltransferase